MLDIYDSEIIKLEGVVAALRSMQAKNVPLEEFRKEAIERFAEVGFVVDVKTFETTQKGTYAFDFEIMDRVTKIEFDHDQMRHEIVHDALELGEAGTISDDGVWHTP